MNIRITKWNIIGKCLFARFASKLIFVMSIFQGFRGSECLGIVDQSNFVVNALRLLIRILESHF